MARRRVEQIVDGESIVLDDGQDLILACCDCGLTHRWTWSVAHEDDGTHRLVLTPVIHARSTAARRRHHPDLRDFFKRHGSVAS